MIVISVSGGKDSIAMSCLALRTKPKEDLIFVYQDTGMDHPVLYDYLDYVERHLGIEIVRVRSSKYKDIFDLIEKRVAVPMVYGRFCTSDMKIRPFKEWLKENKLNNAKTEIWIGVRADESAKRTERYGLLSPDDLFSATDFNPEFNKTHFSTVKVRLPIVNWAVSDVFAEIERAGIKRNPLYDMGALRVGCFPCLLGSDNNWLMAWKDPHGRRTILRLAELELMVQTKRKKRAKYHRKYALAEFIPMLEARAKAGGLFDEDGDTVVACSWCQS